MNSDSAKSAFRPKAVNPEDITGYLVELTSNLPSEYYFPGEQVIALRDLQTLELPIDKVLTIAFCSAGYSSRGYEMSRHPFQVCRTEFGFAVGYSWSEIPIATGKTLIQALDNAGVFTRTSIAYELAHRN